MDCELCGDTAEKVCPFCGTAYCSDHVEELGSRCGICGEWLEDIKD